MAISATNSSVLWTAPANMAAASLTALDAKAQPHAFDFHVSTYRFRPGASGSQCAIALELPASSVGETPLPEVKRHRVHVSFFALVKDAGGQVVRSRLDEAKLRAIAQATHGAYYSLGPLGEGLAKVRLALEALNTGPGSTPARKLGVDRFHWPVAGVLGLLVAESLIGTRRRLRDIGR